MGIAAILAENERLRQAVAAREQVLSAQAQVLAERALALTQQQQALAERDAKIAALEASNEDLARRLELARLRVMGRRNERDTDDRSLPLPFGFPTLDPPLRLPVKESDGQGKAAEEPPRPKGPRPQRRSLADRTDLPRRKVRSAVAPEAACGKCGGALRVFGSAVTHRLEWVPGHFELLEVSRERCACPACPSEGVLVAPGPGFALPRALCANGLLARVLVDKFADRIPLHLQVKRMQREGETFSVATLCDWVKGGSAFLMPIVRAIEARLLRRSWLQGDDTGFPVQDGTDGACRKGRLWVFTDQQEAFYRFTDTKEGKNPAAILSSFVGKLLLVDGGSEFNLAVAELGLSRAGCWSHLRRYFFEARIHHPHEARLALATIRDLFAIEDAVWGADPDTIRTVRERDARPLVDDLFRWFAGLLPTVRPTSALGQALGYALNGRPSFERFLTHPELPMHNNRSELSLRGPVIGRKQWLFAGSEGGAHAAAAMFTLVGSCMLQGIDPWVYLADVLSRLGDHPVNRVHELTPLGWRLARDGQPIT